MTEEQIVTLVESAVRQTMSPSFALPGRLDFNCTLDELSLNSMELIEAVVYIERQIDTEFTDSELDRVRTLADLERLVKSRAA